MFNILSASLNGITQIADDLVILLFLAVLTIITVFASVWFISVNINKSENQIIGKKMNVTAVVAIVIVIGTLIRIAFSIISNGYLGINPTLKSSNLGGMAQIYSIVANFIKTGQVSTSIHPIPFYIFASFGSFLNVFSPVTASSITPAMRILFKLPLIICDIFTAIILFKMAKKYTTSYIGLAVSAIFMICPIFFFTSAIWGSTLSIFILLITLSVYFMTNKNFLGLIITHSLAFLTAKDAMYLAPVFLVFIVYYFIKSLKANRESNQKLSFKKLFLDKERGLIIRIPLYLISCLIAMYLISIPLLESINYNFFDWFNYIFISPFNNIDYLSYNSLSVYNLFGRNNVKVGTIIPLLVLGSLFFILAAALTLVVYVSRKNRAIMVLLCAYVVLVLSVFYMGFSELNLVPVLVFLLLSYVLIKDRRILHVFTILSLTILVNSVAVMMSAGYFSTVDYSAFSTAYSGTAALSGTVFGNLISLFSTGITLLALLYLTVIVLDISLSNKIVQFNVKDKGFTTFIRNWYTFK